MTRLYTEVSGAGEPAVFVHGSFGWGLDTFPHQRDLADSYQVHLIDRAGYGDSPSVDQVGWPTDMHDVADILGGVGPAHMVGQSYGAVVALLAAGLRPECVRSLVVIEPPLFGIAPHDPLAASLTKSLRLLAERAETMDTAGYFAAWAGIVMNLDEDAAKARCASWSARDWAAAESSRREDSPVDAPVALDVLAGLSIPKVMVVGGWPDDLTASRTTGLAFRAVADTIAAQIGAELVVFDRSTHNPQLQQPDEFNQLLRRVWA
jgi:pimeloyl-ACP methyl ester carboxylesterase